MTDLDWIEAAVVDLAAGRVTITQASLVSRLESIHATLLAHKQAMDRRESTIRSLTEQLTRCRQARELGP